MRNTQLLVVYDPTISDFTCILQLSFGRILQELHYQYRSEQRFGAIVSTIVLYRIPQTSCACGTVLPSPCAQAELEVFAAPETLYGEAPAQVN